MENLAEMTNEALLRYFEAASISYGGADANSQAEIDADAQGEAAKAELLRRLGGGMYPAIWAVAHSGFIQSMPHTEKTARTIIQDHLREKPDDCEWEMVKYIPADGVPQAPKDECLYGPVGKHIFNPHDDEPKRCVNCGVPQAEPPKEEK